MMLSSARSLVLQVEDLWESGYDEWESDAYDAMECADAIGAHRVSRALYLVLSDRANSKYGAEALHIRAKGVANVWLNQKERRRYEKRSDSG